MSWGGASLPLEEAVKDLASKNNDDDNFEIQSTPDNPTVAIDQTCDTGDDNDANKGRARAML